MRKYRIVAIVLILMLIMVSVLPLELNAKEDKIQYLLDQGYIEGRDKGDLHLDSYITRAEFAKIIVLVEGLEDKAKELENLNSNFKDVPADHWAKGYINLATKRSFMQGYQNGNFNPEDKISYEEIVAILVRNHPYFNQRQQAWNEHWSKQYLDFGNFLGLYRDLDLGYRDMADYALRGESFIIIYNYLQAPRDQSQDRSKKDQGLYDFYAKDGSIAPALIDKILKELEIAQSAVQVAKLNPSVENKQTIETMISNIEKDIESIPNDFYGGQDFLDKIKSDLRQDLNKVKIEFNSI